MSAATAIKFLEIGVWVCLVITTLGGVTVGIIAILRLMKPKKPTLAPSNGEER